MWQVFNLVFLAIVAAIGLAVFMIVWTLASWLVLRRRRSSAWIFCSLLGLGVYPLILCGWLCYESLASTVFREALGFPATGDVTELRSYKWILGDSGDIYLSFKCSPATAQQIVTAGQLSRSPLASLPPGNLNGWDPPNVQAGMWMFQGTITKARFASEVEVFVYDPATRKAYYHWRGID